MGISSLSEAPEAARSLRPTPLLESGIALVMAQSQYSTKPFPDFLEGIRCYTSGSVQICSGSSRVDRDTPLRERGYYMSKMAEFYSYN